MSDTDLQLLARYTRHDAEDAFAEIVHRHLDLVFSAALRQARSRPLAEEIAQSVFTDLARQAHRLAPDTVLAAWLYQVTRRTAIDVVRRESRRQLREQKASPFDAMNAGNTDWTQIEPLLDEAMHALADTDRAAVLLRYFQNKSLREVGEALGTNEDTARKRVSRAVDRLREFFAERGVTVGAGGVAVVISANAVQAAPAGLAAALSTTVLTGTEIAAVTTTTSTAAKTIAMTTFQKTLVAATIVLVAGTGLYEAHQVSHPDHAAPSLQPAASSLAEQIRQLQLERDAATNRLASLLVENVQLRSNQNAAELLKLRGEVTRLRNEENDPTALSAKALVEKVSKLKQRLQEVPNAKIPELQFLTDRDWLNAANDKLETDLDYRRALAALRHAGEEKFVQQLKSALSQYSKANENQLPTEISQLQPYFASPVDDAIMQRWEVAPASTVKSLGMGGDVIITQKTPVDDVFDSRFGVGPNGYGTTDFLSTEIQTTMKPIYKAFQAAHGGEWATDLSEYQPYVTTPEQQVALQKLMDQRAGKR